MQSWMEPVGSRVYQVNQGLHEYNNKSPKKDRSMIINGKGSVKVKPDQAVLTIGVHSEGPTAQKAQEINTQQTNKVIEAIKSSGIIENNDIETISYTIQPKYDYIQGESILKGYTVEHILEIKVKDITKVGPILDLAVKNGANMTHNIQFIVSEAEFYYQEALKLAIYNAKEKAEEMGRVIGVEVNKVPIEMIESSERPIPIHNSTAKLYTTFESGVAPPIQQGELEINAAVKTIFIY